ncbi:hypothetical protein AK812_SmicGene586 [Symbiodinium microadriaticum]|uniref:Uncharacterized protein n=1 Tax=Symbiodinium microadriaticum TaxID=2951 RepID=A0A1Q9F679_SYMMI|nr:hypothetical protein AK812_SmicGene586 [Symbiodinium microadriaticum]
MSIAITGSSDGLTLGEGVPLPPGEESEALRLQAVLAGRRLQSEHPDGQGGTWQTEWMEHDDKLFFEGPSESTSLTLFLILLRTVDVLGERFSQRGDYQTLAAEETAVSMTQSVNLLQGMSWLYPLLSIVDRASADFRLRLLVLRVLVHRAELLQPVLMGKNVEVFRFVVSMLLDPRFCAEKRFHYLVSTLLVPKLGQEEMEGPQLPRDCVMDAERLLHQLQVTCPHKMTYWQRAHLAILRLFASHYLSRKRTFRLEDITVVLLRQLTAKNKEIAIVLQQSSVLGMGLGGLRQLVIFLEPCA